MLVFLLLLRAAAATTTAGVSVASAAAVTATAAAEVTREATAKSLLALNTNVHAGMRSAVSNWPTANVNMALVALGLTYIALVNNPGAQATILVRGYNDVVRPW
jgi:hypothetical protein